MNVRPFAPKHISNFNRCSNIESLSHAHSPNIAKPTDAKSANNRRYLSSQQIDYTKKGWENRLASALVSLPSIDEKDGAVMIIDIKQSQGRPVYRYYSNGTHKELYEPWSSSKIFAFTGAMAKLKARYPQLNADGSIGNTAISDLVTSINTYQLSGLASGDSNAIATFFANVATRDYLTSLFYENWLNLDTPGHLFRGSYGSEAFSPASTKYKAIGKTSNTAYSQNLVFNNDASKDRGYRSYRCDNCGLTGNKAMTSLAQAEWLKRLVMHESDKATSHPHLAQEDINTLFFGKQNGGMSQGISNLLQNAIARTFN